LAGFELHEAPARPADSPAGPIPADQSWSPLESWIWEKLQAGAIANIDEYEDDNGRLPPADPRKVDDWQNGRRRLTPRFLEDLLLREPYRSGLHRKGMRVEVAWFADQIDLEWADVVRQVWLERCRFEQPVLLTGLLTPHSVSFTGSAFAADLRLSLGRIGGRVDLTGTQVAGTLEIDSADIAERLVMSSNRSVSEHGAEFNDVVLNSAKVSGFVDFSCAKVNGTLDMASADIGQHLFTRSDVSVSEQRAEFNEVVLTSAKIGGQVDLIGAQVASTIRMDSAHIGPILIMASHRSVSEHRAEFNDVVLRGAKIGGQVSLTGAKVNGTLWMDSADIGQSLYMSTDRCVSEHRAEFYDVVLRGAKVGGQVGLIAAKVAGTLDIASADIGQQLLMRSESEQRAEFNEVVLLAAKIGGQVDLRGAKVTGTLDMIFAEIRRNVDVRGAVLSGLNLTGTGIGGVFRLASPSTPPKWKDGAKLVLRNASVDAIQDTEEEGAWPPVLDLDGFTYRRLGGLGAGAKAGVAKRGARWFIDWLAKGEPYTPGPYQQCAQVLRELGHPEMANAVLYAGRERERKQAWRSCNKLRATGLLLLKWFVGYGYGQRLLWHPLAWVGLLVAAGTAVLHLTGIPTELAGSDAAVVAYSFDTLLPIVELEKSFADVVLHGFAKYYFYFQKLMDWVLASFLIAGLSGLTK
jgi:uncharacterized protein YjbI with pentapeptide repeats